MIVSRQLAKAEKGNERNVLHRLGVEDHYSEPLKKNNFILHKMKTQSNVLNEARVLSRQRMMETKKKDAGSFHG